MVTRVKDCTNPLRTDNLRSGASAVAVWEHSHGQVIVRSLCKVMSVGWGRESRGHLSPPGSNGGHRARERALIVESPSI